MRKMRPKTYSAVATTGGRILQLSALPAERKFAVSLLPALLTGAAGACSLLLLLDLAVLSRWLVLLLASATEAAAAPTTLALLALSACPHMAHCRGEGLS